MAVGAPPSQTADRHEAERQSMDDFDSFAQARWGALVRTAYLMGCSPADSEDHAQSALSTIWRKWRHVRNAEDPDAYAFRILINTVHRARRRRWTGERPTAEPVAADTPASQDDGPLRLDLRAALLRLPTEQRAVLVLRFLHDLSESEIARVLDVPPGTVKSRSSRGITALRAHLDQEARS